MLFISPEKLFSFLTYLNFCSGLSGQVKKRLDNKVKKNYDVIYWVGYNTHITQSLKK